MTPKFFKFYIQPTVNSMEVSSMISSSISMEIWMMHIQCCNVSPNVALNFIRNASKYIITTIFFEAMM
jgi:hypothetical protein